MTVEYADPVDPENQEAVREIETYKRWLCGEAYIPSSHVVRHSPFDDIKLAVQNISALPAEINEMIIEYLVR